MTFQNITISVQLPGAGHYDDAVITLVTPAKDAADRKALLARFLWSLRFFNRD